MLRRAHFIRRSLPNFLVELALIIIGVLSALAVENFRESVAERRKEREYLLALREAVQSDTAVTRKEIQRCFNKQKACAIFLQLADGNKPKEIPQDQFEDMVASVVMLIDPVYNTATYEDLKSSGNLKILSNSDLRNAVISYYADLYKTSTRFTEMATQTSYNEEFTDVLDPEEFSFDKEISQSKVIGQLKNDERSKLYLKRLQKRVMAMKSAFIYQLLPKSLDLLDKLNLEISKR